MYVSENESAVEKWHRENGIPMSKARNGEETLHEMGLSKYPTALLIIFPMSKKAC